MDVIQEMSDRRLKNLRAKADEGTFLGVDNNKAIKAIDDELKRRHHECPQCHKNNAMIGTSPDDSDEAYLHCNDCGFEKIEHL